jgi:hypothetical protein
MLSMRLNNCVLEVRLFMTTFANLFFVGFMTPFSKDSVSQQNPIDIPHIDFSKLSGGVLSRATDALNEVKRL